MSSLHRSDEALTTEQPRLPYGVSKKLKTVCILVSVATFSDNNVLIVIGGDSYYKNEDEEAWSFISGWAKRKVVQFGEEYLDGRQLKLYLLLE